ncbi:MAG TPA: M50 family metallopeptidase [Candidatus Saccharimonadales bacterium]|nr:M50 family metallopeptidase [Candidatus Saccharimonadales bacterium]
MGIFLLIVGLVLFIGLVVVHELGHFWAARRGGVDVEEFGIFFPPLLFRHRTKSGYDFTINLLPLGGFVKLRGEHDSDTGKGSYGAAGTRIKIKIMLAGVAMNLLAALVIFTALALLGMPRLIDNQFTVKSDTHVVKRAVLVGGIESGSPASQVGLQVRDQITAIGGSVGADPCHGGDPCAIINTPERTISSSQDLVKATSDYAKYHGSAIKLSYIRDGKAHTTYVNLRSDKVVNASHKTNHPKGHLGVAPAEYVVQRSTWSAPVVAVGLGAQLTALTYQGLWHALQGIGGIVAGAFTGNHVAREHAQTSASSQVSGPVGIYVILKDGSLLGYQFMLLIIGVISLTLAIMNVLPIPALDGGRLFVMLISRLFRKSISPGAEEAIYGTGFVVLLLLIIVITVVDVRRFF